MFSTIKSIIKNLSIFSLFATIVVAGLSNVDASAVVSCPDGRGGSFNIADGNTCPGGNSGTGSAGSGTLLAPVCPNNQCPGYKNAGQGGTQIASKTGVAKVILNFASFFIYIATAISVVFIVWGGYNYINATDPKGNENGKKILINALIGLAICILSITIVSFVSGTLTSDIGGNLAGQVTNT